jgi:hypothetical protein
VQRWDAAKPDSQALISPPVPNGHDFEIDRLRGDEEKLPEAAHSSAVDTNGPMALPRDADFMDTHDQRRSILPFKLTHCRLVEDWEGDTALPLFGLRPVVLPDLNRR